jgi:hypothetical protein
MPQITRAAPYAEPVWSSRGYSAYYNDSHLRLRREIRAYVEKEIIPYAAEWEQAGSVPVEVWPPFLASSNVTTVALAKCFQASTKILLQRIDGCVNIPFAF